jgi:hypothetical protein
MYVITKIEIILIFITIISYCNTTQTANDTGLYKTLQKRLDSIPNSRCTLPSECIQSVKPGLRNVFSEVKFLICKKQCSHFLLIV